MLTLVMELVVFILAWYYALLVVLVTVAKMLMIQVVDGVVGLLVASSFVQSIAEGMS